MTFKKDEWALNRIDVNVTKYVWVQYSFLFSSDKNQSSMTDETPWEEIYDNFVPFR